MKYMAANIMHYIRNGSAILKMLNIIQIYLLLCSPHLTCAGNTTGIYFQCSRVKLCEIRNS